MAVRAGAESYLAEKRIDYLPRRWHPVATGPERITASIDIKITCHASPPHQPG
jgi:hypothetical protein